MRGNPILNSLRTAEAAGYPALLIVSAVCLGLVVGPVALLGLTDAGWVLGLALLYLVVAVVVLSVAVGAALSEGDEPDAEGQGPGSRESDERHPIERPPVVGRQPGTWPGVAGPGAPSQPLGSLGGRRRPSAVPAAAARDPAAERIEEGVDGGERGAARSVPDVGLRLDARRARRVMPRPPGRRSPHQG
jgi:hypothetical protein